MDAVVRALDALPLTERRALAVLVALHRAASRTDIARVLAGAGVRGADGKPLSPAVLLPMFKRWKASKFVHQHPNAAWGVEPRTMHALAEHLVTDGLLEAVAQGVRKHECSDLRWGMREQDASRELFLALYLPRPPQLDALVLRGVAGSDASLHYVAYGPHVPLTALQRAAPTDAQAFLEGALPFAVERLVPLGGGILDYAHAAGSSAARASAAQYLALRDEPEQARVMLGESKNEFSCAALAFIALTKGELEPARAHARDAIDHTRAKSSKRIKGLAHPLWPWITLLLLTDQADPSSAAMGVQQLAIGKRRYRCSFELEECLEHVHRALNETESARPFEYYPSSSDSWSDLILCGAALSCLERPRPRGHGEGCQRWGDVARDHGFAWATRALARGGELPLVVREAPWQRALRALERAIPQPTAEPVERTERIVWVLETMGGEPRVTPRLQTQRGARFSGGRAVSLRRLHGAATDDPLLDAHDRRVVAQLRAQPNPFAPQHPDLRFSPDAVQALVGHPRVYADAGCDQPVAVERAQPSLLVEERDDGGWRVRVEPPACASLPAVVERVAEDCMRVYVPTVEQRAVLSQLPRNGIELPAEAREPARKTLGKLASLFSTSSALELTSREVVEIEADARIHVQLRRLRAGGMRAAFCVAPLPTAARLLAGEGNAVMLAPRSGETLRCVRDLARERDELAWLYDALKVDRSLFELTSLVDCLELVSQLQALGERVVVEWPDGDPLTIAAQRELSDLKLRIGSAGEWLRAEGELEVDDTLVLSFRQLLHGAQSQVGRFVVLDDGRYLALSSALQRSIEGVEALARQEDDEVNLHPLAFLALTQLEGAALEMAPELAQRLQRMRESSSLVPRVPPTFEATLRPYQRDGFAFLHRLAHWEAGACLADDMGLGKTLQTLALLVERAPGGPALVVAPTSVCANWCDEARRYAPTLRVRRFGAGDRERTMQELGPFDILVCSYGVLQQESERLSNVHFQTVVLDEAQAIKNAGTQRARAAMSLQASVRIALTGTPIENHLGELWSILNFINPGLLGSEREFERRFVRPIQREGDRQRGQLLRRLVSPFVLRRKKSEVLDDLPEKTVITLRIAPSAAEEALYEALRAEALQRVQRSAQPGQARIQLFAELMRMRRAACDPALVLPEGAPPSSKLAAFEELVAELRDNGHRALVFSQFVDCLALVRARLDGLGVHYQYLDGSSTPAARSASVNAFQSGDGDLFLISLKAGGFGLNLTAADYVIHLDPWWNPAVEDQASDRAHRIGQERPVTIYRLVMQGSIEEKILALHASKRELADDVLEGQSRAPFATEQLLELLAEAHGALPAARLASKQTGEIEPPALTSTGAIRARGRR